MTHRGQHAGQALVKAHLQGVHLVVHHHHGRVDGQADDVLLTSAGHELGRREGGREGRVEK